MKPNDNELPKELEKYFKICLSSTMSVEEKMDELSGLPVEDLLILMEHVKNDEEYQICNAIKTILEENKSPNEASNDFHNI